MVDVRGEPKWQQKRIEASLNFPLPKLKERIKELPLNQKIMVHCGSGYRSSSAASLLLQQGFTNDGPGRRLWRLGALLP